MSKAEEAYWNR